MTKRKNHLLTILAVLSISVGFAQNNKELQPPVLPIDSATKLITYREVVTQKGTADELFQRATDWISAHYKNTAEVIKSSDKATGMIECASKIKIHTPAKDGTTTLAGIVNYNFTIAIKEGRYRFAFTRFSLKDAAYNPIEKWFDTKLSSWYPQRYNHLQEVNSEMLTTIISLKEAMKGKVEKQDNW